MASNTASSTPAGSPGNYSPQEQMGVVPNDGSKGLFIWFIAAIHCFGALQFGYNTNIVSGALPPIAEYFDFAKVDSTSSDEGKSGNSVLKGIVVSAILVGALISALVSGRLADRFGRNLTNLCAEGVFFVGALICAFSVNVWMLVAGRFILGLGVGCVSVVVSLIITEIAPQKIRGQIATLNQLSICTGIFLSFVLGTVFGFIPKVNWRIMVGFSIVFCILHWILGGVLFRTESPKWLIMVKRNDDARKMLQYLRGYDDVEVEMNELIAAASEDSKQPSAREAFKMLLSPIRPLIVVIMLMFIQQISGINAILYYLTTFLENAGMTQDMANYMSILVGGILVIMTIVSMFLVDRVGRKPLMLTSLIGMACAHVIIGIFGHVNMSESSSGIGSVVFTIIFVMFFSVGLGPVPWCMVPELFPNSTRGLAVSISVFTNWTTNLGVSLAFLPLSDATSQSAVLWGFAVLCALGATFIFFVVPETKGRTVEEIVASMKK
eukprot:m51a1_g7254 hypothetical protein (494) ;mRNA; f:153227-155216